MEQSNRPIVEHSRESAPRLWWYVVACGFFAMIVIFFSGFLYLNQLQQQQIAANKRAEQQRVASLHILCSMESDTRDYYSSLHSEPGDRLAQHWEEIRKLSGCDALKGGK
jgi:hypothetical protein